MKFRYFFAIIAFILVGCGKDSGKIDWEMPTPYAEGVFHTENIYQFVKDVNQLSGGKITIHVHSGASLFNLPEIKRAVRNGQVAIGETLISSLGNENPIYQIDSLPLLATSYQQAKQLWTVSRSEIEELLLQDNLKLLFAVPWPPQGLYVKKEIKSLADMKGLKIRVYNATLSRLAELMGSSPSTVQTPEIPQAFSTGIIDAMITSPSTGVSSQCWDYVKYYYDIRAWIPKNMVIVNKNAFESLPKELQTAVLEAALAAEERGWKMSAEETEKSTNILAEHGMQIIEPSDFFKKSLSWIKNQMTEEWRTEAGSKGEKILTSFFAEQSIEQQK